MSFSLAQMNIGDLVDRSAISLRVSAANKRQALAVISEIAARNFGLDVGEVLDALTERELAGSTGVGHGVAAPHARLEGLQRIADLEMDELPFDQPLKGDGNPM